MMNAQDIKNGTCIRMDGQLYFVIEFLHVKPGKGNTVMRTKLKNVVDGRVLERRFNIGEKLEDVRVERRPYSYLYQDGSDVLEFRTHECVALSGFYVEELHHEIETAVHTDAGAVLDVLSVHHML